MADLFLVVDAGGSQTKVIYQTPTDDRPECLLMPPEVEQISQRQFDRYQARIGWLGVPSPQQQAWLSVGEQLWAVGAFAAEFDAQDRLREKKYENALYKVLAAVGVIVQKLGMTKRKVALHLAILLPWQEFNDRKVFEAQLTEMLGMVVFRGMALKLSLRAFLCRPEGGGLAATRMRQMGVEWFQRQRLGVLLLGHRNTSALFFERGQFKRGDSPLYGFSRMIDLVVARYSVLDKQALLLALVKAMTWARAEQDGRNQLLEPRWGKGMVNPVRYPCWNRAEAIRGLVAVRDESLKEAELTEFNEAIEMAIEEYWEMLEAWIKRVVPDDLDEVIISGGAALMLEPKLVRFFAEGRREGPFEGALSWDAELKGPMREAFNWRGEEALYATARFADAYGLFDQMLAAEGA